MKKGVIILMPLLMMFSMQAMEKTKKKVPSMNGNENRAALDKWALRRHMEQMQAMNKKTEEKVPPMGKNDNTQVIFASNKYEQRKKMNHPTCREKWETIPPKGLWALRKQSL